VNAQAPRIIGGKFRRTRLPVLNKPGLRPTPDRVRETLFNWLGQDLRGWHCLDAFAGSGALGFEAASRDAASVCMVESDAQVFAQLNAMQARLQCTSVRLVRGDALTVLAQTPLGTLDLVFLDPPFASDLFDAALQRAAQAIAPHGFIYLEAPRRWPELALQQVGLVAFRTLKAGAVHAHLLQRREESAL